MTMKEFIKKLEELEQRITVLEAAKTLAAAPPAEPTAPEELPGFNDLDEFKPDSFKGGPETVPAADGPPKFDEDIPDPFADGVQLTDEQLLELETNQDDDDESVAEDDGFYDCPACGGIAIINKSMKRCPACQNYLDWSD